MGLVSLLWGMVSIVWMIIAFIPLLGWGNWFMIPFAGVGAIIAGIAIALTTPANRGRAKTGLLLNVVALIVGVIRLQPGGGLI